MAGKVLEHLTKKDLSYCSLMEIMMEGGDANETNQDTKENPLHVLYKQAVRPLELYNTTKLLVENGCEINAEDSCKTTPLEWLVLHINRGLIHHKPSLNELKHMEEMSEKQTDIDKAAVNFDADYQKQVFRCLSYLLQKGANCDIVPAELPSIPHDKIWSEAFEHKIMQQEQRWRLLKFGTGMTYSKYNIFNPLTKHRVSNTHSLTLLHLVAWRGDAECLKEVLKHCSNAALSGSDGRNALHLLYHYCNKPRDLVQCTRLLLDAGVDPNQADDNGNTPVFLLLKHTFVKKSYIRYLANSYHLSDLNIVAAEDNLTAEMEETISALKENDPSVDLSHKNAAGDTALHAVFRQLRQVLRDCDPEFQQTGHAMVPYSFSIKPATRIVGHLVKCGTPGNLVNNDEQTALHLLCGCLCDMSLTPGVNTAEDIAACFEVLLKGGVDPNIKDASGNTAQFYLPACPVIHSSATEKFLEYREPIIVLLADFGADLNACDANGSTLLFTFFSTLLKTRGRAFAQMNDLQTMVAPLFQKFVCLLVSRGADPSVLCREGRRKHSCLKYWCRAPHQCDDDDYHSTGWPFRSHINVDALQKILQPMVHNMTQASLWKAIASDFLDCPQIGLQLTGCPARQVDLLSFGKDSQRLLLWKQSLDCAVCKMLLDSATQPRRLKHACRLSIWRCLGRRFARDHVKLPLPPALKEYVGDLCST